MDRTFAFAAVRGATLIVAVLLFPAMAQQPAAQSESSQPSQAMGTHETDRRGNQEEPRETYAVARGTRFLVKLEGELDSRKTHENARFEVLTLEPLDAGKGVYLRPGAVIEGHVRRVDPATDAGRARIWLIFDDIHTQFGSFPVVAEVVSVPGDRTVREGINNQGFIEARPVATRAALQAAAMGAAMGAVPGVRIKQKKVAAGGALLGALNAYLQEAARGREISLPEGEKLELQLQRALYVAKD